MGNDHIQETFTEYLLHLIYCAVPENLDIGFRLVRHRMSDKLLRTRIHKIFAVILFVNRIRSLQLNSIAWSLMFHFFCLLLFSSLGTYKFHKSCDCHLFINVVSTLPSDFYGLFSFIQRAHQNQRLNAFLRMRDKGSISWRQFLKHCPNNCLEAHQNANSWLTSNQRNQNLHLPGQGACILPASPRQNDNQRAGLRDQNLWPQIGGYQ